MAKKYNYYLVRLIRPTDPNQCFLYARGEAFESDYLEGLALVRSSDVNDSLLFNGDYSIIDIKSGLFVKMGKSKKKVLDWWNEKKLDTEFDLKGEISRARTTESYKKNARFCSDEKKLWRKAGYRVED